MTAEPLHWDPDRYLAFGEERSRPFADLVTRIAVESPCTVVDLGCGPGHLTVMLGRRWPEARVLGLDSSKDMIRAARARDREAREQVQAHARVRFVVGDLQEWPGSSDAPTGGVDVLVCHAVLQWVPGHLELLPRLLGTLRPGGWLAFQVPGNFAEPSHTIRRELAAEPAYAVHTAAVASPQAYDAATYFEVLGELGCAVDAWETTYLHVLSGPDPVFRWVSGTGARPTLQALPDGLRADFEDEFRRRLREAYPERGCGVVLPFRRVFVVTQAPH